MAKQATAGRALAAVVTVVVLAWMAGSALASDAVDAPDQAGASGAGGSGAGASGAGATPPSEPVPGEAVVVSGGGFGAAATTTEVVDNGDGTATVTILLTVENAGPAELHDVSLVDDVVGHLVDLSPTDFVTLDGSLMANPRWDGTARTSAVADGQTLQPGQRGDVGISFTVATPSPAVDNQVLAAASGGDGETVTAAATHVVGGPEPS